MRSALPTIMVLLAVLMAACDRTGSPIAPKSSKAPIRKASPTPSARGSLPPGASPAAVPSGPDTLFKPKEASVGLTGTIALDARYALEQKGTFISDQGGGLISDKGGSLISNNGGGLIANNGSNLIDRSGGGILSHHGAGLTGKVKFISDQGGGFISDQGGGFISDQGGGLISNNGGALISNNGGGLVSNNGGGLVSNNGGGLVSKTKFALLSDAFDALLPGHGRALQAAEARHGAVPAGGMLVGVISLLDGAYLPLGVDRAGKAVYFVYTDAKGQFQVHLPASLAKRVLVVSSAPGSDDPRLAVDLVANTGAGAAVQVDDSTTVVTAYLRQTVSARLVEALDPDPCKPAPQPGNTVAAIGFGLAVGVFKDVFELPDFKALPRAARLRVLARFAEVAIGNTDLRAADIKPELAEKSTVRGLAYPALVGILRDIEAAAAKKLEADPTYFDGAPYLAIANRERGSGPAWAIRKPADLTEFLVAAYLTSNDLNMMRRMEAPLVDVGLSPQLKEEIQVAGGSIFAALVPGFSTPEGEDQMRRALKAAIATEKAGTPPPEPTCLPGEAPPTADAEVSTLAGGDEAEVKDGVAATARFKRPAGLAYDPRGFLLVADQDGDRIRKIDLVDGTHPVTTVAGTGEEGWADGPGATAKLFKPVGLALDGKGALYVSERGNHRIRKITGFEGANAQVTTVAGSGLAAWADGVGVAASFNEPAGLAMGPDGALYVADKANHRIRKIAFEADGTARVSTFAGSGTKEFNNAVGLEARFADPRGVGFLPGGFMLVGDGGNDLVRIASQAAQVATYAGQVNEGGADGTFNTAQFDVPTAFAIDARGVAYVADAQSHRIRRLGRDGWVTTIAGGGTTGKDGGGFAEGVGAAARFNSPEGIAFGEGGVLYVADAANRRIRIVKPK